MQKNMHHIKKTMQISMRIKKSLLKDCAANIYAYAGSFLGTRTSVDSLFKSRFNSESAPTDHNNEDSQVVTTTTACIVEFYSLQVSIC